MNRFMRISLREPVSGLMHYLAAIAAVGGLAALLLLARGDGAKQRASLVYGASLVLMLMASASYHLIRGRPERLRLLQKIDHSAIYVFIAGTYTAFCLIRFSGFWQWGIPSIMWTLALAGSAVKIFVIRGPRWVTAGTYLVMGWLSLLALGEMLRALPLAAFVWLVLGGVAFTLGALVYITRKPDFVPGVFGFHEVWHLLVLGGCACHYIAVVVSLSAAPGMGLVGA